MAIKFELPADLARDIEAEAARRGQKTEDTVFDLLRESVGLRRAEREPANRSARISALLDRWDAEDAANPSDTPLPDPPRVNFRVPDLG